MSRHGSEEETPLLQSQGRTPLPRFQLSIILFLHLAEPLSALVINPFAPQVSCTSLRYLFSLMISVSVTKLIRDIGITHGEEARVGYYVGMLVRACRYPAGSNSLFF